LTHSEDNSRYFTGSFGNVGTPQQVSTFNKTQSEDDSSSEDSEEDSEDDSIDYSTNKQVSNFMPVTSFLTQKKQIDRPVVTDRVQTAHKSTRGGKVMGRQIITPTESQFTDLNQLVVNNQHVKNHLDNESRGFALHLVNSQDNNLIQICQNYNSTGNLKIFLDNIEDLCNNFANNFYSREFSQDQLSILQQKNDNNELDYLFEDF